jgi:hypothetical protein
VLPQLQLIVYVQLLLLLTLLLLQDKVYSLSIDAKLDENCMADMIAAGYSRVLVYSGDNVANVRGYLQVLTSQCSMYMFRSNHCVLCA